jgi:hypothetical protein
MCVVFWINMGKRLRGKDLKFSIRFLNIFGGIDLFIRKRVKMPD